MDPEPILLHLSMVAVTLAGFSGVVVALGRRSEGLWQRGELRRLAELLGLSLSAALFAVLPGLLGLSGMDAASSWRMSAATTLVFWLLQSGSAMLDPERRRSPLAWVDVLIALLFGVALALVAIGVITRGHVFVYTLAIFAMLATAAARFYWLLMTGVCAD
ncbi:MAG: hypothetical protein KDE27_02805 [Planctomycetes bacterium]|nr:hypothetical protein [Planctomycetota bacterium]